MGTIHNGRVGLHREDIKAAIRKRGLSLAELSRLFGDSGGEVVRMALRRPWPAVEERIARFLKCSAAEIWPDRYDATGAPIRQRKRASKYEQQRRTKA